MTEDEMIGWYHQLDGLEFEQAPGVDDGQGGLACCSPWGCKELDMTERLNRTEAPWMLYPIGSFYLLACLLFQVDYAGISMQDGWEN